MLMRGVGVEPNRHSGLLGSALRERLGGFTRGVTLTDRLHAVDLKEEEGVLPEFETVQVDER